MVSLYADTLYFQTLWRKSKFFAKLYSLLNFTLPWLKFLLAHIFHLGMVFQKTTVKRDFKKHKWQSTRFFFVIFNSFYFTFRTSIHCNGVPVSEFWLWEWLVMWDVFATSLVIDLWMFFCPKSSKAWLLIFFFSVHI